MMVLKMYELVRRKKYQIFNKFPYSATTELEPFKIWSVITHLQVSDSNPYSGVELNSWTMGFNIITPLYGDVTHK